MYDGDVVAAIQLVNETGGKDLHALLSLMLKFIKLFPKKANWVVSNIKYATGAHSCS